jgi:hypothetical protein
MELNRFKTDSSLEAQGVWIELGEGAAIRVARVGNSKNAALFSRLTDDPEYKRKEKMGTLTDSENEAIVVRTLGETILLDWRGFKENGEDVKYSQEKAFEMLKFRDFRRIVQEAANDADNFRSEQVKIALEALKKSSNGS